MTKHTQQAPWSIPPDEAGKAMYENVNYRIIKIEYLPEAIDTEYRTLAQRAPSRTASYRKVSRVGIENGVIAFSCRSEGKDVDIAIPLAVIRAIKAVK